MGRPLANTQIYILDEQSQLVPIGVEGELHIGGDGLAREYLNRPELTAEKFIDNPFASEKSARLYKTGDSARYLSDGNIEYLGRIDNQVKIRGFRIELGEIEEVLNNHETIKQAVVIATGNSIEHKQLVAYIVSQLSSELNNSELIDYLQEKFPVYMVPSAFVMVETLPLTPNGKIDRKALANLDISIEREQELILPRSTIELQLAKTWSEVLHIEPIGVTDNFFELGGHSLLAVMLMSKIKQQFQQDLPLSMLFQNPTIEQMATLFSSGQNFRSSSTLVPIKSNSTLPPLFCVHPVGGNALCYQNLASCLDSEQPIYGIESFGLNPQHKPHTSVEQMADHYIQDIQSVQPHGPYSLSGWSMGGIVAFEMAQQLLEKGEEIAFLGLIDSYPSSFFEREIETQDSAELIIKLLGQDLLGQDFELCLEQIQELSLDEQLKYVVKTAKQKNLVSKDFEFTQAQHLLKINKFNALALAKYQPQYFPGMVSLFRAADTKIQLESSWDKLVQKLELHVVSGSNHLNIVKVPYVKILAQLFPR